MNNLFQWHGPAVKKLLGWRQGDEEEKWAEKAVDSLVKKLKKKKSGQGTIEDLEYALANPGSHSKCVTIPKSLDGRLQVSHKKGLPHVIYCRVWRWPDLQSHQELRPVPECLYPYDSKNQHICINPYHYIRVESAKNRFGVPGAGMVPAIQSTSPALPMQIPSPLGSYTTSSPSISSYQTATSPQSALSDDDDMGMLQAPPPPVAPVAQFQKLVLPNPPVYWSTIAYYELNTRVGELFKMWSKMVIVDGFTDPSNTENRICLGTISNVNRNAVTEKTRKYIGRGLRLDCSPEHNITITNLSEAPLFLQSRNCNIKMNMLPNAVCRIPPGHNYMIFDNNLFSHMLQRACKEGYTALYDLQKMCLIRLSFVKGWGPEYNRHDVTSTPCWIEIQLHQPLAWIDSHLPISSRPEVDATSMS